MGFRGEGPGDLEPALLSIGQVAGVVVGVTLDANKTEMLHRPLGDLALLATRKRGAEDGVPKLGLHAYVLTDFDVVEGAHVLEEPDVLKGPRDAQLRRPVRLGAGDIATFKNDSTCSRHMHTGDAV